MDRGDVLVFETDDEKFENWEYFRAIKAVTEENRENPEIDKATGSKMYLIGNVFTKDKKVLKGEKLFIGDFFQLAQAGKARVADDSDSALIFLTNKEF